MLKEYRSRIRKFFSRDMFIFHVGLLRMSLKVGEALPYQKTSGRIVLPSAPVTTRAVNASMLYFRKQFAQGVMTRPLGSVTEVLPSYQCCRFFGTSIGTPATRSGRLLSELVPPLASGKTKPVWAVKTLPSLQPPIKVSTHDRVLKKRPPSP